MLVSIAWKGTGTMASGGEFGPERRKGGGDETNIGRLFGRDAAIWTWLLGGYEK